MNRRALRNKKEILKAIIKCINEEGRNPTYLDLIVDTGCHPRTICNHIKHLESDGQLSVIRTPGMANKYTALSCLQPD